MRLKASLLLAMLAGCSFYGMASQEVPSDEYFVVLHAREVVPSILHLAVTQMVAQCTGSESVDIAAIRWTVADTIVGYPSGQLAYGLGGGFGVMIERRYWFNTTVISHEVVHMLGYSHGSMEIGACTISSGLELPYRMVDADDLRVIVERGLSIGKRGG